MNGQITVTTAGTPVAGPSVAGPAAFLIKAHPNNTDTVWVALAAAPGTTGFPFNPGETVIVTLSNLNQLQVDADVSGEKLCWMRLNGP